MEIRNERKKKEERKEGREGGEWEGGRRVERGKGQNMFSSPWGCCQQQ